MSWYWGKLVGWASWFWGELTVNAELSVGNTPLRKKIQCTCTYAHTHTAVIVRLNCYNLAGTTLLQLLFGLHISTLQLIMMAISHLIEYFYIA